MFWKQLNSEEESRRQQQENESSLYWENNEDSYNYTDYWNADYNEIYNVSYCNEEVGQKVPGDNKLRSYNKDFLDVSCHRKKIHL